MGLVVWVYGSGGMVGGYGSKESVSIYMCAGVNFVHLLILSKILCAGQPFIVSVHETNEEVPYIYIHIFVLLLFFG